MMTSKKIMSVLAAVVLLLVVAHGASAQGIVICGSPGQPDCQATHLFGMIYRVVNLMVSMAGLISILFVVIGGAQMMFSGGDSGRFNNAKQTIWNAILGLVMVMVSYLVVAYIANGLGLDLGDPLLRNFLPRP